MCLVFLWSGRRPCPCRFKVSAPLRSVQSQRPQDVVHPVIRTDKKRDTDVSRFFMERTPPLPLSVQGLRFESCHPRENFWFFEILLLLCYFFEAIYGCQLNILIFSIMLLSRSFNSSITCRYIALVT